jgi:hypothetical protein
MSGAQLADVTVSGLTTRRDLRGELVVAELQRDVPFPILRLFYVRDVPAGTVRGRHGHYRCRQMMVCQQGRIRVDISDGNVERHFTLLPGHFLVLEPGLIGTETYLEDDSILLVLCDQPYDPEDYIYTLEALAAFRAQS